jgi:ATP-dependent Lon protease
MNPTIRLPMLPLRDIVVFPLMTVPLLAGRAKSLKACEDALGQGGHILLVAQRDAAVEDPSPADLYAIGVIATVLQHLAISNGRLKLLVRGERRARIANVIDDPVRFTADAKPLEDVEGGPSSNAPDFALANWTVDDRAGPSTNRVAELQHILEEEALTAAERLSAASGLIGG